MNEKWEEDDYKTCDFCLRSEAEISPIKSLGDDEGLWICIDCERIEEEKEDDIS